MHICFAALKETKKRNIQLKIEREAIVYISLANWGVGNGGWTVQDKTNERKMTYSFRGEFDNPWWRNYKIGMSSQITHFIYLLHLETLYSVVVLKRNQLVIQSNVQVCYITLGQGSKNNSMLEKRPVIIQKLSTMLIFLG